MEVPIGHKREIGKRLQQALDARSVSQIDLARAFGWSDGSQVNKWCKGVTAPSAEYLVEIPKLLQISGHWLLTGDGTMDDEPEEAQRVVEEVRRLVTEGPSAAGAELAEKAHDAVEKAIAEAQRKNEGSKPA